MIPKITKFIKDNLEKTEESKSLIKLLNTWTKISRILYITYILSHKRDNYIQTIEK